ncbi:MAG: flap endonuclease [SAR202 cluster bacterium]|nr:flap endonuclease [SAR202 cluster bacterium]
MMKLHLVDGTYELFRAYYGAPPSNAPDGRPVGATRGLLQTLLSLLRQPDVTHVGVAFDHIVESFRNELFGGYKTGGGVPTDLANQFELAERVARALGFVVWPMVEFEADDAIATAVARWAEAPGVDQVVICSPDKDMMQLIRGQDVVSLDRRRQIVIDYKGVVEKFGVEPGSIPDYLALVGDTSDGIPGVPRWGAKSASLVLKRYKRIEAIPENPMLWDVSVRGAKSMANELKEHRSVVDLYKELATLRLDVPLTESLEDLKWKGARSSEYNILCSELGFQTLATAPSQWRDD